MKIIKSMLKEELKNSLAMKQGYERELAKLPHGSLVKKIIKGHVYYYLQKRENGKIRYEYKGKLSREELKSYRQIKQYKTKYRRLLSEVKRQIRFLQGSLRAKKSV